MNIESYNPIFIVLGSFSVATGLAWNDVIQTMISDYIPSTNAKRTLAAKFVYAIIVTVVVVAFAIILLKIMSRIPYVGNDIKLARDTVDKTARKTLSIPLEKNDGDKL